MKLCYLQMAGISEVGRNHFGVFPLRGKLLNVREANNWQVDSNEEIQSIQRILGLEKGKQYDCVESLRYGHLMIMTDQVQFPISKFSKFRLPFIFSVKGTQNELC